MAAQAEPRGRARTRQEHNHEHIGAMVFEQEKQHQNSEREYKLEHNKPGAKKLKQRVAETTRIASQPLEPLTDLKASTPYDEVVAKEEA